VTFGEEKDSIYRKKMRLEALMQNK